MECPFCGQEMEAGFLQSTGGGAVFWTEKPKAFSTLLNPDIIGEHDWIHGFSAPALRCTVCRKIIVAYEKSYHTTIKEGHYYG